MSTFQSFTEIEGWQRRGSLRSRFTESQSERRFRETLSYGGRYETLAYRSCPISQRALTETVPGSLFSSFRLQKVLRPRSPRNLCCPGSEIHHKRRVRAIVF